MSLEEDARKAYISIKLEGYDGVDNVNEDNDLNPRQFLKKSRPYSDIIYKDEDGILKFVEIKATKVKSGKKCFGAITQSEMEYAIKQKYTDNYLFVFMILGENNQFKIGKIVTASELLNKKALTCPPVKYYFNIDPTEENIEEFNRRETTMVATKGTVNFHSELSSLMDLIANGNDVDVDMGNFLGLVTLLKMGNLRNENVRNNLFQFMIDNNLTCILPGYIDR